MTFLDTSSSLSLLSEKSLEKLALVDNYVLDFNIFLFKGILDTHRSHNGQLSETVSQLMSSIPEEYQDKIFNPLNEEKHVVYTTTNRLQSRMLELLIHERHKRDIAMINDKLGGKLSYVPLEKPLVYEIKSPFFLTFNQSKNDYQQQFYRLALLQLLEYDFEHELTEDGDYTCDDDLIDDFCSEAVMNFKLENAKDEKDVMDNEIIKVLIPLASQVLLMNDSDEEEE